MSEKTVLIIGINGFVGSYLKNELESNGYKVYGCDCTIKNTRDDFFRVDITNFEEIYQLIKKLNPRYIYNLAAVSSVSFSWEHPQATINVNVCGTINILETIRKLNINSKVLLIGSSEEYAPSDKPVSESSRLEAVNPYGISRIMIEDFVRIYRLRYNMDIVCIRAFNHTGLGQTPVFVLPSFIDQVAKITLSNNCGKIKVGNITVYRDFSDVRDIVYAYRLIAECEEKLDVVNVGSGIAYKIEDLLKFIISLSNQNIEIVIDKERFRPADLPYCCCDNQLLKSKTNWVQKFNIFDTLKEMYHKKISDCQIC